MLHGGSVAVKVEPTEPNCFVAGGSHLLFFEAS